MKTFVLDYTKWRSGREGKFQVGEGGTLLLNPKGFMCCLGQFSLQCGVSPKALLGRSTPGDMSAINSTEEFRKTLLKGVDNSDFASDCMMVNDDEKLSPGEKLTMLTMLFWEQGYKLVVKNEPDWNKTTND